MVSSELAVQACRSNPESSSFIQSGNVNPITFESYDHLAPIALIVWRLRPEHQASSSTLNVGLPMFESVHPSISIYHIDTAQLSLPVDTH